MSHVLPFQDPGLGAAWDRALGRRAGRGFVRQARRARRGAVVPKFLPAFGPGVIAGRIESIAVPGVSTIGEIHGLGFKGIKRLRKKVHKIHKVARRASFSRTIVGRSKPKRRRARGFARAVVPVRTAQAATMGEAFDQQLGELQGIGKGLKKFRKKIHKATKKIVKSKAFKYAAIGAAAYFTAGAALKFAPKLLAMGKGGGGALLKAGASVLKSGVLTKAAPPVPGSVEYYDQQPYYQQGPYGPYGMQPYQQEPSIYGPYETPSPYGTQYMIEPSDAALIRSGAVIPAGDDSGGGLGISPAVMAGGAALLLVTIVALSRGRS